MPSATHFSAGVTQRQSACFPSNTLMYIRVLLSSFYSLPNGHTLLSRTLTLIFYHLFTLTTIQD